MTVLLPHVLIAMSFLLTAWIACRWRDGLVSSIASGLFVLGFVIIGAITMVAFWSGSDNLHHLEYQEYAPKAESFLVASDYSILHWGEINGPIRSYARVQKTFVWKVDDNITPKQVVVLEAKGSVRAAEKYYEISDSLDELELEEFVGVTTDTFQTNPIDYVGNGINPTFQYSDILLRSLRLWPAVRLKCVKPAYKNRWSIHNYNKESDE